MEDVAIHIGLLCLEHLQTFSLVCKDFAATARVVRGVFDRCEITTEYYDSWYDDGCLCDDCEGISMIYHHNFIPKRVRVELARGVSYAATSIAPGRDEHFSLEISGGGIVRGVEDFQTAVVILRETLRVVKTRKNRWLSAWYLIKEERTRIKFARMLEDMEIMLFGKYS